MPVLQSLLLFPQSFLEYLGDAQGDKLVSGCRLPWGSQGSQLSNEPTPGLEKLIKCSLSFLSLFFFFKILFIYS